MNRIRVVTALSLAAGLMACSGNKGSGSSSTTTSGSGGTSGSGATSGSSGTASSSGTGAGSSSSGAATVYCDGFQASSASGTDIDVQYYAFNRSLERGGCDGAVLDGGTYSQLGGIWDLDTSDDGAGSPAHALFPASCSDLGFPIVAATPRDGGGEGHGGFDAGIATDGGYDFLPYDGGLTVVEARVKEADAGVTLWGVVTAVNPWSNSSTDARSGVVYVQDPVTAGEMPAPASGVSVYFDKTNLAGVGSDIPHQGDVVVLTELGWSPYNGESQFAATAATTIKTIGTAPLPPAISLAGTDLTPSGDSTSTPYLGMRVTTNDGPYTASATCPTALEYQ